MSLDEGRFPALELNNRRLSVKNSFCRKNGVYTRSVIKVVIKQPYGKIIGLSVPASHLRRERERERERERSPPDNSDLNPLFLLLKAAPEKNSCFNELLYLSESQLQDVQRAETTTLFKGNHCD